MAPHQLRVAQQRQQLNESLKEVLAAAEESGQLGLAILQGARALSLADGDFDQEEWELFYFCLKSLSLSDAQRHSEDLDGAPDPRRISASLAAIADPAPFAWLLRIGAEPARSLSPLWPCVQLVGSLSAWLRPAASPLGFSPPPPLNGHG
jgi:hypothetical protein